MSCSGLRPHQEGKWGRGGVPAAGNCLLAIGCRVGPSWDESEAQIPFSLSRSCCCCSNIYILGKVQRRPVGESRDSIGCQKLERAARPWEVFTVQLLLCQQQEQLYSTFLWIISLVRFEYFLVFLERLLWHIFTYLLELFQHIFSYSCVNSVDTGQLYLFWEILRKNTKEENPFFTASGYLLNKKTLVAKMFLLFETDISNFSSRSTKACWHWNYPGRK